MGVVHKLTKELGEFVLNKKKEQPSLSCRKLVDIVEKTYSVRLSKSSINTLIKESHLSSPVGRPVERRKRKSFEIPEQRKQQLFPPAQTLPGADVQEEVVPTAAKEVAPPTPPAEPRPEPEMPTEQKTVQPGVMLDSMGSIFLKAAEWELSGRSIFGGLLKAHCRDKSVADHDVIGEVLLFAEAFGVNGLEELTQYSKQGLWAINGLTERYPPLAIFRAIDSVEDKKSLSLDLSIEAPQLFSEALGLKMILEDGTEVLMDGQLSSFWTLNVQSEFSFPINKVMNYCADKILNNVQSVILACDQGIKDFTPEFYNFILAMENTPGKRITAVNAIDLSGQEIASFSAIPNKKRTFMMGVWPWQSKFSQIKASEDVARLESLTREGPLSPLFYQEIILSLDRRHQSLEWRDGPALKVRAFLLRKGIEDAPFMAIVTNGSQKKLGAQTIIMEYFDRWPSLDQGAICGNLRRWAQLRSEEESAVNQMIPNNLSTGSLTRSDLEVAFAKMTHPDISELFRLFLGGLHNYCQRKYFALPCRDFDMELMRTAIYSLPGFLTAQKDQLVCRLIVPNKEFMYFKELASAASNVNERDILDRMGRRLHIEISFN